MRQTGDRRTWAASVVTRTSTRAASVALVVYLLPMVAVLAAAPPAGFALPDVPAPKVVSAPEIGRHGGTFALTSPFEPQTFNLVVATSGVTIRSVSNAFERFVVRNRLTTQVEPNLAESWTTSADGRSWRFRLRRGVRWFDGRLLTADDVIFTLDAIFTTGVHTDWRDLLTIAGQRIEYRKLDDLTVEITTARPFGALLEAMQFFVLPKHRLEDALKQGAPVFNSMWGVNTNPRDLIGNGPFVMQSYTPGQRIVFVRNPWYWKVDRAGRRLPYLTRIAIEFVPNTDAARLRFMGKEIDLYTARAREFADLRRQEQVGNFKIFDGGPLLLVQYLMFNQNPAGVRPPKLAWFQDARFRRAMSHAIDQEAIVRQVYDGRAVVNFSPLTPANTVFFNPRTRRYPYDPLRAEALLREAGFAKGPDGLLRDGSGSVVEFTLHIAAGLPDLTIMAEMIRQDLARIGVRVFVAPETVNALLGRLDGASNWEAMFLDYGDPLDPYRIQHIWKSSGLGHRWWPRQERPQTDWEAEIDRIFDDAATTVDQARRKRLYDRWQEIAAEQVPLIYLPVPFAQPAYRNTLGNVSPAPLAFHDVESLFYRAPYR